MVYKSYLKNEEFDTPYISIVDSINSRPLSYNWQVEPQKWPNYANGRDSYMWNKSEVNN